MKSAAISRLKASLSEYLDRVKAGEEVIVTERGKPIARIIPPSADGVSLPSHLRELERAGLVKMGSGRLPKDFWKVRRPDDLRGAAVRALSEERASGR
jgi:prevent-host-death family protein